MKGKMELFEKTEEFETHIRMGEERAIDFVKQRFEDAPDERNRLEFHKSSHTKDVIRRTRAILSALEKIGTASRRDVEIGGLAGAFHDTVQNWEENKINDGNQIRVMRKRFVGANEKASADEAVAFMKKTNREAEQELFNEADIAFVREAIDVTIPGFDPQKNTVIQPNMNEHSSLIARAVALADLGTAGMDSPEAFAREGDALFREENLDIKDKLSKEKIVSEDEKENFQKRMLGWSKFQPKFAQGRKERLQSELRGMPKKAREEIQKLFQGFDQAIVVAQEIANKRESMFFKDLARDMGYKF